MKLTHKLKGKRLIISRYFWLAFTLNHIIFVFPRTGRAYGMKSWKELPYILFTYAPKYL